MSASTITTRVATSSELGDVIELCLEAFADEAVTAWVTPDPAARQHYMREMFGTSLKAAIAAEALILAIAPGDVPVAASIWLPRSAAGDASPTEPSAGADGVQQRVATVEAATEARRPDVAHLHLSAMATLPSHRGRGAGGVMLTAGLDRARRLGLPVYLEASTSDNRRLYERSGFHDLGEPIHLPDDGPSLQPMWLDS